MAKELGGMISRRNDRLSQAVRSMPVGLGENSAATALGVYISCKFAHKKKNR
jgi:hypothetical protein